MVVFCKPNSAITDMLCADHGAESLHYEAELSFLYQSGQFTAVALGLDLTKRALQTRLKNKGLPWERAKAFDGSAIFSEFVAIEQNTINQLQLLLTINGVDKQQGGVSSMIIKPEQILKELQTFISLEDGDIVMTGTPKGVGKINRNDNFVGKVYLNTPSAITAKQPFIAVSWQVN
jgi:2-keto-4-pentenoate hydratase/2-oxohepta-3-ene-1,7-dioic acid hydratase in catechol pathway